jgi:dTDP-4-dehydrorhamnose 3,5-epimerase
MIFSPSPILPEVIIVEPELFPDNRGYFMETYHLAKFSNGGIDIRFVQDNQSMSVRGTLRGLHYQIGKPQGKLVRVLYGEVFDVAVDIRRSSPNFGRWFGTILLLRTKRPFIFPRTSRMAFAS